MELSDEVQKIKKKKRFGCIFAAVITGLFLMVAAATFKPPKVPAEVKVPVKKTEEYRRLSVETLTQQSVQARLTLCKTIDFSSANIFKMEDNVYSVYGRVTGKNAAGHVLIANYDCYITLKTDSTGTCSELNIHKLN